VTKIIGYKTLLIKRSTIVLATSYGRPNQFKEHVLVVLEGENGVRGWGESTPLPKFTGETTHSVKLILEEELLPAIVGLDSYDIVKCHNIMDKTIYGNFSAKMAIDTALYDLHAKTLQVPLYELLGGCERRSIIINRHLGIMPVDEAVKKSCEYVKEGFKSIKIKVGNNVSEDIERVLAIRDAVGPSIRMRIDANGGYTYQQALCVIKELCGVNLEMFEQPLPRENIEEMISLHRIAHMPIGVDESINSLQDALLFAQHGAADVFTLKLVKTGGLYSAIQIANVAHAANISCVVASTYDTQLNAAYCLHLACAIPGDVIPCDLTCYATQPQEANTCHILENGTLTVGNDMGCGVNSLSEIGCL